MENVVFIVWCDIVGDVMFQFCESDWEFVIELVLDFGMYFFLWCNVVCVDFSICEDFEVFLNSICDEFDQIEQEDCLFVEVCVVIDDVDDLMVEECDFVEVYVVVWVMVEFGVD